MNIAGMLTEDEVKKVATQMITKRRLPLVRLPRLLNMFTYAHQSIDIVWDIFPGPFDRPRDSKSSLVQFATTKIRGLVVCKGGYLRGGSHPDWNLISIYSPV